MKEKILVVGGTGFIGYHILKKINLINYDLYSFSKNLPDKKDRIRHVNYLKGDITNYKDLKKKLALNFKHIINCSGYINHKKKNENILCHFQGTKNLVDIFKKKKIKTFIQIGSSLEYGNQPSPQTEKSKTVAKSFYAKSKLLASLYIKKTSKDYNFPYIILRPYQIYGPKQKKNRLIPQTIDACKKNKNFKCTNGLQSRDFLYVNDFVELIKKILKKNIRNQIYNVGFGSPLQVKFVINKINAIIGSGRPLFGSIRMRKEETKILYPSIEKVRRDFEWHPRETFLEGLKKTISFYNKND